MLQAPIQRLDVVADRPARREPQGLGARVIDQRSLQAPRLRFRDPPLRRLQERVLVLGAGRDRAALGVAGGAVRVALRCGAQRLVHAASAKEIPLQPPGGPPVAARWQVLVPGRVRRRVEEREGGAVDASRAGSYPRPPWVGATAGSINEAACGGSAIATGGRSTRRARGAPRKRTPTSCCGSASWSAVRDA